MESQASASLSSPLLESEVGANGSGSCASGSHSIRGSKASNTASKKDTGASEELSGERLMVPNEMWVEIGEEMAKPMVGRVVRRATQVRLETLSDTGLAMVFVALLLGVLVPWAVIQATLRTVDDDDNIYARGSCQLAYNASAVDDMMNAADEELDDACDTEAVVRLRLAAFLGAFTIMWAIRVAVHWGYCYCDYCVKKCASWLGLSSLSKSNNSTLLSDNGEEEAETELPSHKQNRFTMAWPHCAVLLFLAGQIMLEDPSAAFAYHASGQIDQFVFGGALRKWQTVGCACMTFAVLLLVDHCHRAAGASTEASKSPLPSGAMIGETSRIESHVKASVKHGVNPGPGKFLAMALASCWPLFFYGHVIGSRDALFQDGTTSLSAENKHIIRVVFCSLSLGASMRWMLNAYLAVRAAPYMSHRYENLLLRLVLPPAFITLALVTIFAYTFAVLYITTLILPLFLAYAHLPPGSAQLHPVIRSRHKFLALLFARRRAALNRKHRSRVRQAVSAAHGSNTGGRERLRNPAVMAAAVATAASEVAAQAEYSLVAGFERGVGALGNLVGIDLGMGAQAPFQDHDIEDFDDMGSDSLRGDTTSAQQHENDRSNSNCNGINKCSTICSDDEIENHTDSKGNSSSASEDEDVDEDEDVRLGNGKYSRQRLPRKPALCLETALWAAQLSNLAYWDPTGPVPSFLEDNADKFSNSCDVTNPDDVNETPRKHLDLPVPSANGCGKLNESDLCGLARHSIYLAAAIHDYGTGTHVHVYVQDHDSETSDTSLGKLPKRTRTVWVSFRGTSSAAELYYKDLDTKQMPLTLQSVDSQEDNDTTTENDGSNFGIGGSSIDRRASQRCCRCCAGCMLCTSGLIFCGMAACCCAVCCPLRLDDKNTVAHAHRGFWVAYAAVVTTVRIRLFAVLSDIILSSPSKPVTNAASHNRRSEQLSSSPTPLSAVVFCGHSLGGALASIAALDFNLAMKQGVVLEPLHPEDAAAATAALAKSQGEAQSPLQEGGIASATATTNATADSAAPTPASSPSSDAAPLLPESGVIADTASTLPTIPSLKALRKRLACVECFTFGSPRAGDLPLVLLSRRFLPLCWRVVCEGDLVTALPRVHCGPLTFCEACSPRLCCGNLFCGLREYKHLGIPAFLGRKNAARGDLLINPSGVERVAYLHWARSMASHQVYGYLKALLLVAAHVPDLLGGDGVSSQNKGHGQVRGGASGSRQLISASENAVCTRGAAADTRSGGVPDVDIESGGNSTGTLTQNNAFKRF